MFASCIPDVLLQARSVVIECDVRLEALFRRSFPGAGVHGAPRDGNRDWLSAFPQLDLQVAAGSLPRFLRRQWSDFPRHSGYLVADPARVAYWKSRLAPLGDGLKIGISWRGGTRGTRQEARSLTIEQFSPLLTAGGCAFICLQNGDCSQEIEILRRNGAMLHWWPEATRNFDEMAALIKALDLVVVVPSSVLHLAGALGQPVWGLVSATPEWRYLWEGERMPWYPTVRMSRQRQYGDWLTVIDQVRAQLVLYAQSR